MSINYYLINYVLCTNVEQILYTLLLKRLTCQYIEGAIFSVISTKYRDRVVLSFGSNVQRMLFNKNAVNDWGMAQGEVPRL